MLPKMMIDINGSLMPVMRMGTSVDVDGTSASAQSSVIDASADSVVRIVANGSDIRVLTGTDPTALDTSMLIPADSWDYIRVPAGHKVAVKGGNANIMVLG